MPEDLDSLAKLYRDDLIRSKCSTWQWLMHDDFEHLHFFRETIERFIESEETRDVDALPPEARANLADNYPYWWQDIVGDRFRSSFLVALLSAVEVHLVRLCNNVKAIANAPISRSDLKGQNILEQSKRFLAAFGHFHRPDDPSWDYVRDLYHVRNCIIHNQGLISQYTRGHRIQEFVRTNSNISLQNEHIELAAPFCEAAIGKVGSFFEDLRVELVALCDRAGQFAA
jgi:hypothetical protein